MKDSTALNLDIGTKVGTPSDAQAPVTTLDGVPAPRRSQAPVYRTIELFEQIDRARSCLAQAFNVDVEIARLRTNAEWNLRIHLMRRTERRMSDSYLDGKALIDVESVNKHILEAIEILNELKDVNATIQSFLFASRGEVNVSIELHPLQSDPLEAMSHHEEATVFSKPSTQIVKVRRSKSSRLKEI